MSKKTDVAEDFYVPGRDLTGSSVRIVVNLPPPLNQTLNKIVNSGKLPFKTKDDVVGWCLYHGVKTIKSSNVNIDLTPILEMTILIGRTQFQLKKSLEFFSKLDTAVIELLTLTFQRNYAQRLVRAVEEVILCMPFGRDRSLYLTRLRSRWGHVLIGREDEAIESNEDDRQ